MRARAHTSLEPRNTYALEHSWYPSSCTCRVHSIHRSPYGPSSSAAQCQSAGFSTEAHTSAARTRLRMDEASGPAVVSHRGIDSTQAIAIEALRRCGAADTDSLEHGAVVERPAAWRPGGLEEEGWFGVCGVGRTSPRGGVLEEYPRGT